MLIYSWYEEGSEAPRFKSGPPSNSGLQGPPFQSLNLNIIVSRRFEPLLLQNLYITNGLIPSLTFLQENLDPPFYDFSNSL